MGTGMTIEGATVIAKLRVFNYLPCFYVRSVLISPLQLSIMKNISQVLVRTWEFFFNFWVRC
ncbi:hypothetical protein wTpre_715 [Wolbachia endosymbiont of Trichogramma pretiosum]|nr:hypothetical protein wTpre_715 [Wolbachia endosymbiont of Trichogramma pretiosum]